MAKKSSNPVGRPKNTYGTETLLNNKKSFKLDRNIVVDKWVDALVVVSVILVVACIIMYFVSKKVSG